MLFKVIWYADRGLRYGHVGLCLFGSLLNAPFDLADLFQILAETRAVGCGKLFLKPGYLIHNRIEKTDRLLPSRLALGVGAAVAKQPLEDDLRTVLHWKGHGGRL